MALYRRNGIYYVKIANKGQKPIRESTGTSDPKQAQEYHDLRVAELWRVSALGEQPKIVLADAIATWLAESSVHKRTHEDDRRRVRTMLPLLPDVTIDRVKTATLAKLHADIVRTRECKPATANRYLEIISAVLNYARKNDQLTHVPSIPYADEKKKTPQFLTQAEAAGLLPSCRSTCPAWLGSRWRPACANPTCVNSSGDKSIWIETSPGSGWRTPRRTSRSGCRSTPTRWKRYGSVSTATNASSSLYEGNPIAYKVNNSAFRAARARAGVAWCRWHDLRHTWASWHVMNGTPLEVLQKLGGWADLTMVMRYAHLAPSYTAQFVANSSRVKAPDTNQDTAERTVTEKPAQVVEKMGWLMGLEPTTTGITTRDSTN